MNHGSKPRLLLQMAIYAGAVALTLALVFQGCGPPRIGEACTLEPCGFPDGEEPLNANSICDLQVECDSFTCLSFRGDGDNTRRPFCTEACEPDPLCADPINPETCDDPQSTCPRNWVCSVVAEVVGPNEPVNCLLENPGGGSRCACVHCCDIDPNLCRNGPEDCT